MSPDCECSICLVDMDCAEFIDAGGICVNCKKQIDLIISRGGDINPIFTYTSMRRRETRKKVEDYINKKIK